MAIFSGKLNSPSLWPSLPNERLNVHEMCREDLHSIIDLIADVQSIFLLAERDVQGKVELSILTSHASTNSNELPFRCKLLYLVITRIAHIDNYYHLCQSQLLAVYPNAYSLYNYMNNDE